MKRELAAAGRHWGLFLAWAATIAVVWAGLERHHFNPTRDRLSAEITFGGAVVIFISVLIMLVETERWTLRRLGVFGLVTLDCCVYGSLGAGTLWGVKLTGRELNVLRALLLVSAVLLLVSQIRYIKARLAHRWDARRQGYDAGAPTPIREEAA